MNNQYKDIMSSFPAFSETEPKYIGQDESYGSKPMLFKEVVEGDHFKYAGEILIKTGMRTAQSFRKRNIKQFIFNPGDLVHKTFIASDPLETNEVAMFYCPYIPSQMDRTTDRCVTDSDLIKNTENQKDTQSIKNVVDTDKPQYSIAVIPGSYSHTITVSGGDDYQWSTTFDCNLNQPWSVPIRLKDIDLSLMFMDKKIMLGYINKSSSHSDMTIVWESESIIWDGWDGVETCIITVNNIRLESIDFSF
jgi:hypothetical protein